MLCPWCNQEMAEGFLQSSRSPIFGPEKRKMALWPPKEGEVRLTKQVWNMGCTPAWHCARCKRGVVAYE